MRKLFLLISFVALTISLTSCFNISGPQHSPRIYAYEFLVNPVFAGDSIVSVDDTLRGVYNRENGTYDMDTIYVGDTIVFQPVFDAVIHNLISVQIDWESADMNLWYPLHDSTVTFLTADSDIKAGRLYFVSGIDAFWMPIYFSPLVQRGMNINLTVVTDSEYSTASCKFYFPVKADTISSNPQ
ncbi:MAG: hypothetical protein IIU55_03675 [Paludibacteraceae bacterium]|jgi:hypothetical protein|nr:hypothetical protein [Paludibacteraceae bacterium]